MAQQPIKKTSTLFLKLNRFDPQIEKNCSFMFKDKVDNTERSQRQIQRKSCSGDLFGIPSDKIVSLQIKLPENYKFSTGNAQNILLKKLQAEHLAELKRKEKRQRTIKFTAHQKIQKARLKINVCNSFKLIKNNEIGLNGSQIATQTAAQRQSILKLNDLIKYNDYIKKKNETTKNLIKNVLSSNKDQSYQKYLSLYYRGAIQRMYHNSPSKLKENNIIHPPPQTFTYKQSQKLSKSVKCLTLQCLSKNSTGLMSQKSRTQQKFFVYNDEQSDYQLNQNKKSYGKINKIQQTTFNCQFPIKMATISSTASGHQLSYSNPNYLLPQTRQIQSSQARKSYRSISDKKIQFQQIQSSQVLKQQKEIYQPYFPNFKKKKNHI